MSSQDFFDTKQAAERYGLSASWLCKLRVFGSGPSYLKVGRRVLYDREAFEQWLMNRRRQSTSDSGGIK